VKKLKLRDATPLFVGGSRLVFEHPSNPDLLIKIPRPDISSRWTSKRTRFGRVYLTRRFGAYTDSFRELREYVSIRARQEGHPNFLPLYFGFVETDYGLGVVVGRVCGTDGTPAPTLGQEIRETGFSPDLSRQLDELESAVQQLGLTTGDIGMGNVVCAFSESHGPHLVIVDGIGDKTFLRINTLSSYLRWRTNRRHFAKLRKRAWDIDRDRASIAAASPPLVGEVDGSLASRCCHTAGASIPIGTR